MTTDTKQAAGSWRARRVMRLVARRDIEGPEWTFRRGQRLLGERHPSGWHVWPRRDRGAYLVCVPDELVRVVDA